MDSIPPVWEALDPSGPPRFVWLRRPPEAEAPVLLLGAFDPPTNAHLAVARAASRATGRAAAFCLTKVLLDRPPDELLRPVDRLMLLDRLSADEGFGLGVANRGTYLDVARAVGGDATFVIGSDKLPQLTDPSFYPDAEHGIEATFRTARFLVVPRGGVPVDRGDVDVLAPEDVFPEPEVAAASATEVRRRVRAGDPVDDLVPAPVALTLAGYTEPSDQR